MIRKLFRKCLFLKKAYYYFTQEFNIGKIVLKCAYKRKLMAFKDIHKEERCFIIGNGPSLNVEDLNKIAGEYSFAANRIFFIYPKTKWRPTYYVSQDDIVLLDCIPQFGNLIKETEALFIYNKYYFKCPSVIRKSPKLLFFHQLLGRLYRDNMFSGDISKYIYGGSTVVFACMQIAAYMGFKEIYLLGIDHNYSTNSLKNNHITGEDVNKSYFAAMPKDIAITPPSLEGSDKNYFAAKRYSETHKIKIYNATRGGKLETFERVDFDDIVNYK